MVNRVLLQPWEWLVDQGLLGQAEKLGRTKGEGGLTSSVAYMKYEW